MIDLVHGARDDAMKLPTEEPECAPWRPVAVNRLWEKLVPQPNSAESVASRRRIVAIDGRGGAGKSTVTDLLVNTAPAQAQVVHTDDVAWHHSYFDWNALLAEEVLTPFRQGRQVSFTPDAWRERGRSGAITVPKDCEILLVEGTGVVRGSLASFFDATIFVQADTRVAYDRLLTRDGDTDENRAFIADWNAEEDAVLARERPWERADVVICGTPEVAGVSPAVDELLLGLRSAQRGHPCE